MVYTCNVWVNCLFWCVGCLLGVPFVPPRSFFTFFSLPISSCPSSSLPLHRPSHYIAPRSSSFSLSPYSPHCPRSSYTFRIAYSHTPSPIPSLPFHLSFSPFPSHSLFHPIIDYSLFLSVPITSTSLHPRPPSFPCDSSSPRWKGRMTERKGEALQHRKKKKVGV